MNKYHLELISEVKAHAKKVPQSQVEKFKTYVGTTKTCYSIGTDARALYCQRIA